MLIITRIVDDSLNLIFEARTEVNERNLIEVARPRVPLMRSKGAEFAAGAIPFFGKELIGCAANLAVQGGVKSAAGIAVLAFDFSAASAAVRCTAG